MNKHRLYTIEKDFIAFKEDIKMKATELGMDNATKEEAIFYKNESDFISNITPLPIEQKNKKKRITGYALEPIIIISLAIAIFLFKFIFKL